MTTLFLSVCLSWVTAALPFLSGNSNVDLTVVPGQRVGQITKDTTLEGLKKLYGNAVVEGDIPGPEGSSEPGAYVFKGTNKELRVLWKPEAAEKTAFHIEIIGKAWKFSNGLRFGLPLADVEKINGKAFKILGFEWDMGGYAEFTGGKLKGVVVRFDPKAKNLAGSVIGDRQVASDSPDMQAAKPVVSAIAVFFP